MPKLQYVLGFWDSDFGFSGFRDSAAKDFRIQGFGKFRILVILDLGFVVQAWGNSKSLESS